MLLALETGVKGNQWFSLIDKVYGERTLALAWEKVRANAGACGIDGVTVSRFEANASDRLLAVKEQLRHDIYTPASVKRVWIPKLGSPEKRPLGIPTVRDRVVQSALRMVVEPIWEREFHPQSYGFRPGRSCHDALRRVQELLQSGHCHVVDIDIKGYFDTIPHARLLALVAERIADRRVLGLVESFLAQGVLEGGVTEGATGAGTPQGGVISPLLANIYLNPLDWLMSRAGLEMVRYADDMVVLCRTPEQAQSALATVAGWMEEAGLTLHPEKTRIVAMTAPGSHFDFLGYRFWRAKKGGLKRFVRPKSEKKLKESLRGLTRRANGRSMDGIIAKVNVTLRGWYGYFKHASSLGGIDKWVRSRLRAILRKRRGGRGRSRGRDHCRWRDCYFVELGLFCLEAARQDEINRLRYGVTR